METATANSITPKPTAMSLRCGRLSGTKPQQETLSAEENGKASDSAQQKEQQNLGEQLTDETSSCGSQRLANRDLTTSHTGPGEQEIGDIDATDQQDQPHRAKQQNERLPNAADHGLTERNQAHGQRESQRPRLWRQRSAG
jgi:hypothetical protein